MSYWIERLRERWASPSKEYRKEHAIEAQRQEGKSLFTGGTGSLLSSAKPQQTGNKYYSPNAAVTLE